ncbi:uncharacterized protein LOC141912847 [Tubulanus polymorphus]|uniref:uncharacterized protein LOC141912847 n=1 Tax=Tubulanus polymorphus TaxID=672921 RepID=UPI003DA6C130
MANEILYYPQHRGASLNKGMDVLKGKDRRVSRDRARSPTRFRRRERNKRARSPSRRSRFDRERDYDRYCRKFRRRSSHRSSTSVSDESDSSSRSRSRSRDRHRSRHDRRDTGKYLTQKDFHVFEEKILNLLSSSQQVAATSTTGKPIPDCPVRSSGLFFIRMIFRTDGSFSGMISELVIIIRPSSSPLSAPLSASPLSAPLSVSPLSALLSCLYFIYRLRREAADGVQRIGMRGTLPSQGQTSSQIRCEK